MNKAFRRVLTVLISVVLILSAFPLVSLVYAQTEVTTADQFLNAVSKNENILLEADIVLSDWNRKNYSGSLDGNGHVITTDDTLFDTLSGSVSNLGVVLSDKNVTGRGILANTVSDGSVESSFVYGIVYCTGTGVESFGGLCGTMTQTNGNASVSDSFACVTLETDNVAYSGGLIGLIEKGNVDHSYSSGTLKANSGNVAGLANVLYENESDITTQFTYTSCQIVNRSNYALPSGVNGLYDNQLSVMHENLDNLGSSTSGLMQTTELDDHFALTSSTYPVLKTFYNTKWSDTAQNIVELSVAAAIFSDVSASSRKEPADVMTRADYLSYDSFIDRTNVKSMSWSVKNSSDYDAPCKIYDTVPVTYFQNSTASYSTGTSADLLRSRVVFSSDAQNTRLIATHNGFSRLWYISAYENNPYFNGGSGSDSDPFLIYNNIHLNNVRHYALLTNAHYKVMDNFSTGAFDPIVDFIGNFNGNGHTVSGVNLTEKTDAQMGLFANTRDGSEIHDLVLNSLTASSANKTAGALIGEAVNTKVYNIVLTGENKVDAYLTGGGLIGHAVNCSMNNLLVSVEIDGATAGGLVGHMNGGTLTSCGVTGFVGPTGYLLGGLVGQSSENAVISECYNTAVVISQTDTATAGGLIGISSSSSVTNSYSAALVQASVCSPLVGNGTAGSGCYYDEQFFTDKSPVNALSDSQLCELTISSDKWILADDHYPQLKFFSSTQIFSDLSDRSTVLILYQHYWEDDDADNMTTAWLPPVFDEPEFVQGLNGDSATVLPYAVENTIGYGIEAASDQQRLVARTVSVDQSCVRYVAALRDDLIPLTYKIEGSATLTSDPRTYIEILYRTEVSDEWTPWVATQLMSVCDSQANGRLYDLPDQSQVRVRLVGMNGIKVTQVCAQAENSNVVCIAPDEDGYFVFSVNDTDKTFSKSQDEFISLIITLDSASVPWGVYKDSL